jgi:23S rRNA pseudouridine1911/1915/1917 synthase
VYGTAKKDSGVIDTPIGRSSKDFRQKSVKKIGAKGAREAQTKYKVLAKGEDYSYIEASPKTGRTHQIRVHLKSIGHPVVCDSLYAPGKECPAILGRQALHAYSISLTSQQGEQINIECPVPEDMANMLAEAKLVC